MDTALDLRPTKPTLPILTGRRMWRMGATLRMARFVIFRVNTAGRYQADRSAMTLIGAKLKARMRPSIYGVDSSFALIVDQRSYDRSVRAHALDLMDADEYERVAQR